MHISRFLFLLATSICLSIPAAFSQDSIRTNVLPGEINKVVTLLIPKGDLLIREQYHDWRSNFWFFWTDTVTETDAGLLTGRMGTIDPKEFTWVSGCDPVIRKIRNETMIRQLSHQRGDYSRIEVAYDETIPDSVPRIAQPTQTDEATLCPNAFEVKAMAWHNGELTELRRIYKAKSAREERMNAIIASDDLEKIDAAFIDAFLKSCDSYKPDGFTFIWLAEYRTDALLESVKRLSDTDFRSLQLALWQLPSETEKITVIVYLKASPVKSTRKRKLIRSLKHREQ